MTVVRSTRHDSRPIEARRPVRTVLLVRQIDHGVNCAIGEESLGIGVLGNLRAGGVGRESFGFGGISYSYREEQGKRNKQGREI
jgi:hypothetical protein